MRCPGEARAGRWKVALPGARLALACCYLVIVPARAQERVVAEHFNTWMHANANLQVSRDWWLVQETFWRRSNGVVDPMQLKTGLSIEHQRGPWKLSFGYAYWLTYPYGTFRTLATQPEHRTWQQVDHKHRLFQWPRWKVSHRFRLEERFIERFSRTDGVVVSDGFRYQGRLRWQVQPSFRLSTRVEGAGVFTLLVSGELIARFGDELAEGLFDQSRVGPLFGWQATRMVQLRTGYQWQHLVRLDNVRVENNNTLVFTLQVEVPKSGAKP